MSPVSVKSKGLREEMVTSQGIKKIIISKIESGILFQLKVILAICQPVNEHLLLSSVDRH